MRIASLTLSLVCLFTITFCTSTGIRGGNAVERRQSILEMRQDVLTELYSIKPDTRAQISSASGYAVFTNANINLILASFGGGVGAGVKDFRAVFVFHDRAALDRFMDVGIAVGGQADAAAKAGDLGAAVGGEAIVDNVTAYQLTQSGLALQATIKGTRYWHDSQLN
jgi:hypothetical protein